MDFRKSFLIFFLSDIIKEYLFWSLNHHLNSPQWTSKLLNVHSQISSQCLVLPKAERAWLPKVETGWLPKVETGWLPKTASFGAIKVIFGSQMGEK